MRRAISFDMIGTQLIKNKSGLKSKKAGINTENSNLMTGLKGLQHFCLMLSTMLGGGVDG